MLEIADHADLLKPHRLLDPAYTLFGLGTADLLCLPVGEVSDEELLEDASRQNTAHESLSLAITERVQKVFDGCLLLGQQIQTHEVLDHVEQALVAQLVWTSLERLEGLADRQLQLLFDSCAQR